MNPCRTSRRAARTRYSAAASPGSSTLQDSRQGGDERVRGRPVPDRHPDVLAVETRERVAAPHRPAAFAQQLADVVATRRAQQQEARRRLPAHLDAGHPREPVDQVRPVEASDRAAASASARAPAVVHADRAASAGVDTDQGGAAAASRATSSGAAST